LSEYHTGRRAGRGGDRRSEELGDRCGRAGCAVGLDGAVVDLSPDLLGDRGGDLRRAVELEVDAPTGSIALEAVAYVKVLLEVMAQRAAGDVKGEGGSPLRVWRVRGVGGSSLRPATREGR
jgi:hypothetical protein